MKNILRFFSVLHSAYEKVHSENYIIRQQRYRIRYLEDMLCSSLDSGVDNVVYSREAVECEVNQIISKKKIQINKLIKLI